MEELSLALRLDALSIKGRYDGALFKNSSKPQVLTPKRRVTRERNEDLITVRLYRRDLIELLDDPNTEDEVYLCEGELDLSALTNKINPARLSEIQADRLNAYYLDNSRLKTSINSLSGLKCKL